MLTPLKAIRKKCLECSNYQYKEVELCPIKDCPLYPYRFGGKPSTIKRNAKKRDIASQAPIQERG